MQILKSIFFFGLLAVSSTMGAAEFKSGQSVDFKGDLKEDLYVGAGQVSVTGNITGDLNVVGGDISFKGTVTQDAQFAGGKVQAQISGADDIRIMGGQVNLTIKNSGDVFLMGGDLTLSPESEIGGDLFIMGGKAVVDGRIRGNLHIWGGDVQLKGNIGGDLDLRAENAKIDSQIKGRSKLSSRTLLIEPGARFQSPVEYWSQADVNFHETTKGGSAVMNQDLRGKRDYYNWEKKWVWLALWFPASAAVTIFLFTFFMPGFLRESSEKLLTAPVSSLGYGVLYYLTLPVLSILLFISFIGILHGGFLCALLAWSIMFARPVTSAILAAAFAKKYNKTWSKWILGLVGFGTYLGLSIILMIPVAGMLINLLVVLAASGTVVQTLFERYRLHRKANK
jgi:cytoskeletal protein CcmA (bactofilin family)